MEKKITALFRNNWGIILACLLTIFAMLPLLQPGFFPIHDDEQVGRLYEMDQALKSGHIPPRIAPNLGFGYGYPLFNFYPSFVYYVAELFVLLGFSYIVSIKLMIAAGFILTALFMFLFAREYVGDMGAVISSVAYTYAPYHALDVYVRGALPEFWSFAFIPAIFWSLKKLSDTGKTQYVITLALFSCFLILTHNLVAFMSAIFIGSYVLYLYLNTKKRKQFFLQVLLGGVSGLLLSAFFWVPSYFEKKYTMIELLTKELADYSQHFVYLRQLWDSPWGYGGSLYGLLDGLSFQIGKLHILLSGVILLYAGYLLLQKKREINILLFFGVLFFISVFMMSFYSQFLWDSIQPLSYIQFPWRFLLFAAFTASFLLGGIMLLPLVKGKEIIIGGIVVVLLIVMNVFYFQPARYLTSVTDNDYISKDVIRWRTSIMAFEYVPYGIATKTSPVGTTVIDITEDEVADGMYTVQSGSMEVTPLVDKPQEKQLTVQAREAGILQLHTFSFPGWKVYRNGEEITYRDDNKFKLITIAVPEGKSEIMVKFTDTTIRVIGNVLTVIGMVLLLFITFGGPFIKKIYR